jgi:hypothetical protein
MFSSSMFIVVLLFTQIHNRIGKMLQAIPPGTWALAGSESMLDAWSGSWAHTYATSEATMSDREDSGARVIYKAALPLVFVREGGPGDPFPMAGSLRLSGVQTPGGTVHPTINVELCSDDPLSLDNARELVAALTEAIAEGERMRA